MTTVNQLFEKRTRLDEAIALTDSVLDDIRKFNQEGQTAAGYAAALAAVLMTADIVRVGLSSTFCVAAAEFAAMDKGIESVDKFLKATRNRTA
jgi:hypothetical protein